jgi:hypothetical protein
LSSDLWKTAATDWVDEAAPELLAAVLAHPVAMWMDKRRLTTWTELRHFQTGKMLAKIKMVPAWRVRPPGETPWPGANLETHVPHPKYLALIRQRNVTPQSKENRYYSIGIHDTIADAVAAVEENIGAKFHMLRWQFEKEAP